jgi:hypothetical protein
MPWIKVSKEAHKAMKQYLVDIEGLTLGELVEEAFAYALENLKDFEDGLGIQSDEEEATEEEEEESEEPTED